MKKLYTFFILSLISLNIFAQSGNNPKQDIIQKTNGEEITGKVIKITDSEVTFVYTGETAEYVIRKSDIAKIVHSSGRVEIMGTSGIPAQERQKEPVVMTASSADNHNKIAILPFTYLMENQPGADAIGYKAQDDTYAFLSKHSAGYTILDTRTTNAALAKAGITKDKMMNFTMKEICTILGVEYVIDGIVTQNKSSQTSYTSGSSNTKVKTDNDKNIKGVSSYGSSNSSAAQNYEVSVGLKIYMDTNANIYNQNHRAFFSNTDGSFSSPLEYLLKRCPLYRK